MVEYDIQKILKSAMIIFFILLPLLIVLLCCASYFVRKARGEGSSASWRYLTSANPGRRSSIISRQEVMPLKSAATLIDADSGLGEPVKETTIIPKKTKNNLQKQPDKDDDPDWKYDGVYFTHEPIPGIPEVEFEDKIWDFNDDDVFGSRTNSSFSSPLSGRNFTPPLYSKSSKNNKPKKNNTQVKNDYNFTPSRENISSQISKPVVSPPARLNSTGSTSDSSSTVPVITQAVVNPPSKIIEENIPPPPVLKPFVLPPTTLIPPTIPPPPIPPKNNEIPTNPPRVNKSSISTAI